MQCQVVIDWLTFSVKSDDAEMVIKDWLGMDPDLFQDAGYGLMGYNRCQFFNDIRVLSDGREDLYFHGMGVCVVMSGNGCRTFEKFSKLEARKRGSPFLSLLCMIDAAKDAHVTRIDVACDERKGVLDMDQIIVKVQANEVNSRMMKRRVVYDLDGKDYDGATVYFGAPSSEFRVRIYDKALEQGVEGHWIRVEMVMKGKHANGFVSEVCAGEDVGKLAACVMNDKFSFYERDDTNISRCTICAWWRAFVEEIECVRLVSRQEIEHTVERIASWVQFQVAPSLYIIAKTLGLGALMEICDGAEERLKEYQLALIMDYQHLLQAQKRKMGERCPQVRPVAIPAVS